MRRKPGLTTGDDAHATRIAWWASFFVTVALIALLGVARSAQALTVPVGGGAVTAVTTVPVAPNDEAEEEAEEEGEEEELAAECETTEEGEEECVAEEAASETPEECVLASASASVSASPASDRLHLAVRYTTFSPTTVGVAYWLRGTRGPLSFGGDHAHFARRGVFRQTVTLSPAQMAKAVAAKDFTVQLRPAGAPSSCHRYLDRHLTIRHAAPGGGLTWSDSASSFRH